MSTLTVADAAPGNWVDRHAPAWSRPYLRLARADRPIGSWLLFWPCAWSAALAAPAAGKAWPSLALIALFAVGSIAMRGAGCTYNDLVDRDIDAKVARTASRPIPSGQVTARKAALFLALQLLLGLAVLLALPPFAILIGLLSVAPVASYPFMKRITWWPQAMLGICFSWGALMGYAAELSSLPPAAFALYAASIAWVIGYDTIYALQDIEDDALVGVRSTARLAGARVRPFVAAFYAAAVVLLVLALWLAGAGPAAYAGLVAFAGHLAVQAMRVVPDDGPRAHKLFHSNREAGALLFLGFLVDAVIRGA